MGFDRNTIIGFVLLAVLFFAYFWYTSESQRSAMEVEKRKQDSLAALKPKVDSAQWKLDSVRLTRVQDSMAAGDLANAAIGEEVLTVIENNVMKLTFSNKGGWLKQVELKNYKGPDSQMVRMGGLTTNVFGYGIQTGGSQGTQSSKLYFNPAVVAKAGDGSQTISYQV
ncbi:MAG: membrane protein insertase YidC, partial [Chitinophagaceae bacterium]|nr:membrane protein insertase YidC [Chitinophagaceae bacterium]